MEMEEGRRRRGNHRKWEGADVVVMQGLMAMREMFIYGFEDKEPGVSQEI